MSTSADRRWVRRLTHRAGRNFSVGFRFLPSERRTAVYAAYAFCRLADDAVDEGPREGAEERLEVWARELDATYTGTPGTEAGRALAGALEQFPIPKSAFAGLIEGCRMDLFKARYESFVELLAYCDLVAATISEISLSIFGGSSVEAQARGRDLATALQLTNICRDVGDDVDRGRVYLPADEMAEHGVSERELSRWRRVGREGALGEGLGDGRFSALMRRQVERAIGLFHRAEPVKELVDASCRRGVTLMGAVYATIARDLWSSPLGVLYERHALTNLDYAWIVVSRYARPVFVLGTVPPLIDSPGEAS